MVAATGKRRGMDTCSYIMLLGVTWSMAESKCAVQSYEMGL